MCLRNERPYVRFFENANHGPRSSCSSEIDDAVESFKQNSRTSNFPTSVTLEDDRNRLHLKELSGPERHFNASAFDFAVSPKKTHDRKRFSSPLSPNARLDVQPPGSHIRGHQRAHAAPLEVPQRQVPLTLVLSHRGLQVKPVGPLRAWLGSKSFIRARQERTDAEQFKGRTRQSQRRFYASNKGKQRKGVDQAKRRMQTCFAEDCSGESLRRVCVCAFQVAQLCALHLAGFDFDICVDSCCSNTTCEYKIGSYLAPRGLAWSPKRLQRVRFSTRAGSGFYS